MRLPSFCDEVPRIVMYDPLADFLGAADDGLIEYGYGDVVKLAGHSCPTVAAAYGMTYRALRHLYPGSRPERGGIRVDFRADRLSGVTGVIASVVTQITGATHDTGFKGIAGRFDRRKLLFFMADITSELRFTRIDSGIAVDVEAHLQAAPGDPRIGELMQKCIAGRATPDEAAEFRSSWQDRVRRILQRLDDPEVFELRPVQSHASAELVAKS